MAGVGALSWRRRPSKADEESQPLTSTPEFQSYRDEVQQHLRQLTSLEISTLRHLRRQGMRTFLADRDSPVLRELGRRNLLNPMGSSAFPANAYPYRVPDIVWNELGADPPTGEDAAS